jgi:hypothetical protein
MLVYINNESWYFVLVEHVLEKNSRGRYLALAERGGRGENRKVTNLTRFSLHHILLG